MKTRIRDQEKQKGYKRAWYERNRQQHIDEVLERKREINVWLKEYKARLSCQNCGENHPACLDFHHRDPSTKDNTLAQAVARGWSKKRILDEIEKCDVLCSNCHRKLHWQE